MTRFALVGVLALACVSGRAPARDPVYIAAGTPIAVETVDELSSKHAAKGDLVDLRVSQDVMIGGVIVIPAGAPAKGQIVDARAKGAWGMSGRLNLQPLYLRLDDQTVRLSGQTGEKGSVTAGAVIGMAFLTPGFTGRSAIIPRGTVFRAYVERGVSVAVP